MCGIIGIIGKQPAAPLLMEGLKRLEYRGYDSAGIATLNSENGCTIERRRAEGKLVNLHKRLKQAPVQGTTGIGHTRWATHGEPNETNAHPHATDRVAVVHNGIIENFLELRRSLEVKGHKLASETDTEVIAHLIDDYLSDGKTPEAAVKAALKDLDGAFALAIIFTGHDGLMIGAREGSPLAIGYGDGEMYLGSDALALAPLSERITYLDDGDWCVLNGTGARIFGRDGKTVERPVQTTKASGALSGKGEYRHYMLKEIYEQPQVIGDTLNSFINPKDQKAFLPALPFDLKNISKITLLACGTSYYAGMVARYWLEAVSDLPVEVELASEFRYRHARLPKDGLAIAISQSGETADTLAALRHAKQLNQHTLSVVNVPESTMARESDVALHTNAGPEIGVASTKAFSTQLAVLACFALALGRARGTLKAKDEARLTHALAEVPARAADVLNHDERLKALAEEVAEARDVLYLGRGTSFPIALEGALKLKEISYIHAEGYAAGEMKHGPIALIDENVPVIVIAPSDALFEKTASNMKEVMARKARVIFLTDEKGAAKLGRDAYATIALPDVDPFVAPILYAIPAQLLAYHVAVIKGTDVDQPRNLAKSVTVE